jgi:hypothetical protein
MEAESSADQAKQISVEAPQQQMQEKKKRGRKPAAETKPKASAAYNHENFSPDHTG